MAWKKNSPEVVRRFDELVAVVFRLPPKDAAQLISEGGQPFEQFKGSRAARHARGANSGLGRRERRAR